MTSVSDVSRRTGTASISGLVPIIADGYTPTIAQSDEGTR
jgi:hypothetical protein